MPRRDIDEVTEVPFDRSYWVDEEKLLAGCYPGDRNDDDASKKLEYLLRYGIRHIVNLMHEDERNHAGYGFQPYETRIKQIARKLKCDITISRHPITDYDIPAREQMKAILDEIDLNLRNEKRVYVHCWGGLGRTGTVVGCYLIRHGLATPDDVIDKIRALRSKTSNFYVASPESDTQKKFVKDWKYGQ